MLNAIARLFQRESETPRRRYAKERRNTPRSRRLLLEPMEPRMLLSVSLVGVPEWFDQGPGPENQGGAVAAPNNAVNGAVEMLVMHPTVANMAFAGTVAGGVWRTADITGGGNPANINWHPLTDKLPSLYVGALAFDQRFFLVLAEPNGKLPQVAAITRERIARQTLLQPQGVAESVKQCISRAHGQATIA